MWELTNLKSVEVTDRYFDEALHLDVKNMLLLDPDRLLAGFRETASIIGGIDENSKKILMKGKKRYGGWEDGLIAGHTLGHYIKALSQAQINLGLSISEQGEVKERLDYLIDGLTSARS